MLLDYIVENGKKKNFPMYIVSQLKILSFFPLEIKTHSSFLKRSLGKSVRSISSLLTPASFRSGASAKKGQSQAGRRWAMHGKQAPFLKSAPESPSTAYECLSLSLNQKQEGEDLELAGTPPTHTTPLPHTLKLAKYHIG